MSSEEINIVPLDYSVEHLYLFTDSCCDPYQRAHPVQHFRHLQSTLLTADFGIRIKQAPPSKAPTLRLGPRDGGTAKARENIH